MRESLNSTFCSAVKEAAATVSAYEKKNFGGNHEKVFLPNINFQQNSFDVK